MSPRSHAGDQHRAEFHFLETIPRAEPLSKAILETTYFKKILDIIGRM